MHIKYCITYLAEPHIHERVPGLADFSHVQFTCPWCHQTGGHTSWVWCVQTCQLQKEKAILVNNSTNDLKVTL